MIKKKNTMYNPTAGKDIQGWMEILCLRSF